MKRRILLADDSVTIQKVIELTFMDEDYEVRAVSNGDEAVKLLPEMKPDFVIADVHMPGANGYEVCRRSKALSPQVPVLLLVGTFEPFDEGQARSAGADSHLKKPFDSQELLQRVEELISSRAAAAPPAAPTGPTPTGVADWAAQAAPAARPLSEWTAHAVPEPSPEPPAPAAPDWMSQPGSAFGTSPSLDAGLGTASIPAFEEPEPAWGKPAEPAWEKPAEPAWEKPAEAAWGAPAAPAAPAEPSWGSFELEPEASPFAVSPPAQAAPELFDREPSFSLEPDPGYEVEPEPVFSLDESEPSFAVREDVFGAPSELSLDDTPQDRYLAEEEPAEPERLYVETPVVPAWQTPPVEPELRWSEKEAFVAVPADPPLPEPEAPRSAAPASPQAEAAPAEPSHAGNGHGRLSDEDVDRVARRLVELLGDRAVRDVAWEVIPDLAEVIIRDRLRELESQVE